MTLWTPELLQGDLPAYEAIATAIEDALGRGDLRGGEKLPSHRWLARRLGVAVGTVTRGYELARKRGLLTGEVGRGSFVRERSWLVPSRISYDRDAGSRVDLFQNLPVAVAEEEEAWREALGALAAAPELGSRLNQPWSRPSRRVQVAASGWLTGRGLSPDPEAIVEVPGVQVAVAGVLEALTNPGDGIAFGALSHPIVLALAEKAGLRSVPLHQDEEGLLPEALAAECARRRLKVLVCEPTVQNPTASIMSLERRRHIADLAREHDFWIVETDASTPFFTPPPAPIAALAPERTFHLAELWLAFSLGLRIAFLVTPAKLVATTATAVATLGGLASRLAGEVCARWIRTGAAERIIAARGIELAARFDLVRAALATHRFQGCPQGHHVWLELPAGWRSEGFVAAADRAGIAVTGSGWFQRDRSNPVDAVRVCFGNAPGRDLLERALERLVEVLESRPAAGPFL